jgi:hypothetical protein
MSNNDILHTFAASGASAQTAKQDHYRPEDSRHPRRWPKPIFGGCGL